MKQLKPGSHIHIMGICGTAMASLAALLKERGFKVTGSDQNVYPPMSTFLQDQGIDIMQGYRAENLQPAPDHVVVGNVISRTHEEAVALLDSKIPYSSLPETLRDTVIEDRHSVVVCGTHGKTTTTSIAAWLAEQAKLQPGFLIGGIAKNFATSFRNPKGDWFIIEGDEYDTAFFAKVPKFIFYKPKTAILSSIEFDHADIYKDLNAVLDAFAMLMDIMPKDGLLLYNAEDENIKKILPKCSAKKVSYGWSQGDWQAADLAIKRDGLHFTVTYKGQKQEDLFLPMFGKYNVLNALAVYALAKEHDWSVDIAKAFTEFQGVKRRQELIGEPNGVQVFEDFAHHPTAVEGTLASFKAREGAGRLVAIFEPRSATSRRNYFQKAYVKALSHADEVYICRPYDADKLGEEAMDTAQLTSDIQAGGTTAEEFREVEEILPKVKSHVRPGDTIVIMSNGGFQGIYGKILAEL